MTVTELKWIMVWHFNVRTKTKTTFQIGEIKRRLMWNKKITSCLEKKSIEILTIQVANIVWVLGKMCVGVLMHVDFRWPGSIASHCIIHKQPIGGCFCQRALSSYSSTWQLRDFQNLSSYFLSGQNCRVLNRALST